MDPSSSSNQTETTNSQLFMANNEPKSPKKSLEKIIHIEKQIVAHLEGLYATRPIEKLARPLKIEKKYELINDLKSRLSVIHQKMKEVEEELDFGYLVVEKQSKMGSKEKKRVQMNLHGRLIFFNLRKKYSEVLINSSFVHYKAIARSLEVNETLGILDVEKWLCKCIQKLEKMTENQRNSCCC